MVVLNELTSVFWGVALEGGKKKYSQTTTKPVHISMAALDPTQPCGEGPISVMIEHGTGSYVLCTLRKDILYQQPLNLEFAAGEEISFYIKGNGSVHLSGYFMLEDDYQQYSDMEDDDNDDDELVSSEEDEESSDESVDDQVQKGKKRQITNVNKKSKKGKFTFDDLSEDDEDDDEDDDFILDEAEEASDDEEEDSEDDEDDIEESPKPVDNKKKVAVVNTVKPKVEAPTQQTPGKKQDGSQNKKTPQPSTVTASQPTTTAEVKSNETEGKKKKKKKKKNKNKGNNQEQTTETSNQVNAASPVPVASKPPAKRVGEGGVVIEDLKVGHGPEAKVGKMVRVYYTGRLPNGKAFDCCTSGNGFKFKLGKKEVISGWDVGVSGMKVGGKRKLVIPPKMGYGSQKAGVIPPNSTLVFDVELKSVG